MNIGEIRKVVSSIKTNLFKNSSGQAVGMLKSHFKGTGLRFKDHQIYVHGDDIRFINWKIFAKTSIPYIKTFEEERNLEIVVLIDASPTMLSGWKNVSKLQASMEICCLLYLLAKETGDRVHPIIIADEIWDLLPGTGEKGIIGMISSMSSKNILNSKGDVNISYEYNRLVQQEKKISIIVEHLKKRRELIVLSDLNDFLDNSLLKKIIYRPNLHCFKIQSPLDRAVNFPFSMFAKRTIGNIGGEFLSIATKESLKLQSPIEKRLKLLNVDERYLENFVKKIF